MNQPFIYDCKILDLSDYTFYCSRKAIPSAKSAEDKPAGNPSVDGSQTNLAYAASEEDAILRAARLATSKEHEFSNSFSCGLERDSEVIKDARLLAASCFQGRLWSVTVRSKKTNRPRKDPPERKPWPDDVTSGYAPPAKPEGGTLFSVSDICEVVEGLLFSELEMPTHGAVIVTGATGSAKSQITMGLIHGYMVNCVGKYCDHKTKRKPHLVTVEDPIEEWYLPIARDHRPSGEIVRQTTDESQLRIPSTEPLAPTPEGVEQNSKYGSMPIVLDDFAICKPFAEWPVDYTPRQLDVDVKSVSKALQDALRQTPSAVFISEIRNNVGWRSLMNFAGTGHLVFATGHAGSLTEAMGKILKALRATTPADRAVIAGRIHGLVHVRRETFDSGKTAGLMLTLWRRKGAGKQSFISDGLSALAPELGDENRRSSFGRLSFAEKLLQRRSQPNDLIENVLQKARELDLEGL